MIKNIFAWDLGATKCAAGIVEYNEVTQALECKKRFCVKLNATSSLENLILQLEQGLDFSMAKTDAICIGAAGHYDGENLISEGVYPYPMPFAKIANAKGWPAYAVIHDYATIVCATFTEYMQDKNNVQYLNACTPQIYGRRVALGIGTGLGLKDGVLFPNGDFWLGHNEMGHVGLTTPAHTDLSRLQMHTELVRYLHQEHLLQGTVPVTFEAILSGPGTVRLYKFFYPDALETSPEEVGNKMREGNITEMLDAFAWYSGLFIGTVQLCFMPEGGIWITGGVALSHLDIFERSAFLEGIKSFPAYYAQRQTYPLGLLCNQNHTLMGSGYYAAKRLLQTYPSRDR